MCVVFGIGVCLFGGVTTWEISVWVLCLIFLHVRSRFDVDVRDGRW